jgi:hypothetical protein
MKGFDFGIIYKKRTDNVVMDSLSIIEEVRHEWENDNSMRQK